MFLFDHRQAHYKIRLWKHQGKRPGPVKAAAGTDSVATIARRRQHTAKRRVVKMVIAKTITGRAYRRDQTHHNDQSAQQKTGGLASMCAESDDPDG
jgi:hypothetical protein